MKRYEAPWGTTLITVSLLVTILCLGITFGLWPFLLKGRVPAAVSWTGLLPVVLLFVCALFTIRGYTITPDAILVHRLFWATRVPRAGLQSARVELDAMRWSIRTCGNGGLFSFSGYYRNKALGAYRAFVTDRHRTVVLRYSGHTVVMSPDQSEAFVEELGVKN